MHCLVRMFSTQIASHILAVNRRVHEEIHVYRNLSIFAWIEPKIDPYSFQTVSPLSLLSQNPISAQRLLVY